MQAVVPAAGEGTRLRPRTADRPKGLVDVAGKPLLSHVLGTLTDLGISEIVVVTGYRGEEIRSYYGSSFEGADLVYVCQEERRGLAHALLQAAPHVERDFVCMNGDNVCRANLDAVLQRHRRTEADATTLVDDVSRERATQGGVFELDDGEVVGLTEKPDTPPSTLIPRGFYAFSERIFDACRLVTPADTGEYELSNAVDLLVYAGRRVETVPLEGWCLNVNTPDDCEAVADRLDT
ncbi:MAG: sugar phosphate nucleotidyltransferase [Haloarculaceae archaeon]